MRLMNSSARAAIYMINESKYPYAHVDVAPMHPSPFPRWYLMRRENGQETRSSDLQPVQFPTPTCTRPAQAIPYHPSLIRYYNACPGTGCHWGCLHTNKACSRGPILRGITGEPWCQHSARQFRSWGLFFTAFPRSAKTRLKYQHSQYRNFGAFHSQRERIHFMLFPSSRHVSCHLAWGICYTQHLQSGVYCSAASC